MLPSYISLYESGELFERIEALGSILEKCALCPRRCGANRLKGELGTCRGGAEAMVSSASPHFGEEPPLAGVFGSGTIFLTNCNLRCVFCQNCGISHLGRGREVTSTELAEIMAGLQRQGCHNINFVTPTHYAPQIIAALPEAIDRGLEAPLVWNCGGYESVEVIRLLDGIVDIYMPDVKYSEPEPAKEYSAAPAYPEVVREALLEMQRQVGDLVIDVRGIARRGLLIRHLVMPNGVAGSEKALRFIAEKLSKNAYVNIMDQYRPVYRAGEYGEINRPVTQAEWEEAVRAAHGFGLHRGF